MDTGVKVILCIGETLEERKGGVTLDVCARQLDAVSKIVSDWSNIVVAYEPVWAIGTGLAATPEDAEETHKVLELIWPRALVPNKLKNQNLVWWFSQR